MTIIYLHGILLFRTLQVPETEKCPQYDEGMYDVGATCICDNSEKSPPTNDFKRSGMIKILKCDSVIVTSLSTIHGATSKLYHIMFVRQEVQIIWVGCEIYMYHHVQGFI